MNEAWLLPTLHFLNDLVYLKLKRDRDNFEEQKLMRKYGK